MPSTNDNIFHTSICSNVRCAIPGLEGRQFQFLGLMDCPHEACERGNIPAEQVSKWLNERVEKISLVCREFVCLCRIYQILHGYAVGKISRLKGHVFISDRNFK